MITATRMLAVMIQSTEMTSHKNEEATSMRGTGAMRERVRDKVEVPSE